MSNPIPEEWRKVKIGEDISILTDYTANGSFASLKDNVTYFNERNYAALVRTTDLKQRQFSPKRFTDKKGYDFLKKSSLKPGDIVIANVGSAGEAYRIPDYPMPMTLAPNMYLVKFYESIDDNFIYQLLINEKFYKDLLNNAATTTLNAINKSSFRSIEVLIPPLTEQKKIASILTSVDDVIEKTESQISKLQDLKKGMMQELLTKGIGHTEFKDSPVGRIPKSWEVQSLSSFSLNTKNSFVNGPFGSDLLARELQNEGVPVIYVRDIKNGQYQRISTVCVSEGKADSLPACNVEKYDVIMTKVGDPPCDSAVYKTANRAIVTQDVIRIRSSKDVDPFFLKEILNSTVGRKQIEKIEISGTRTRVSLTDLKKGSNAKTNTKRTS